MPPDWVLKFLASYGSKRSHRTAGPITSSVKPRVYHGRLCSLLGRPPLVFKFIPKPHGRSVETSKHTRQNVHILKFCAKQNHGCHRFARCFKKTRTHVTMGNDHTSESRVFARENWRNLCWVPPPCISLWRCGLSAELHVHRWEKPVESQNTPLRCHSNNISHADRTDCRIVLNLLVIFRCVTLLVSMLRCVSSALSV